MPTNTNINRFFLFSQKALPKVNGGYSAGLDERPAHLVRRYGELYSQMRLETLDALDKLPQLVNSDELKIKLLFSVMVVSDSNFTVHASKNLEKNWYNFGNKDFV